MTTPNETCLKIIQNVGEQMQLQNRRQAAAARTPLVLLSCVGLCLFLLTSYQSQVSMVQHRDDQIPYSRAKARVKPAVNNEGGKKETRKKGMNENSNKGSSSTLRPKNSPSKPVLKSNDENVERIPIPAAPAQDSGKDVLVSRIDESQLSVVGESTSTTPEPVEASAGETEVRLHESEPQKIGVSTEQKAVSNESVDSASGIENKAVSETITATTTLTMNASTIEDPDAFSDAAIEVPTPAATVRGWEQNAMESMLPPSMRYNITCGCPLTCDTVALKRKSKAFTCIDRISFLMGKKHQATEMEACTASAGENGPCGLECHPIYCHNQTALQLPVHNWTRVAAIEPPPERFVRYEKVVMVTKVLWPSELMRLKQMICLFTAAYNRHVNYDIIVFTTIPWTPLQVQELQGVAPQTNIRVVMDSPPLQDQLATMSSDELKFLYERCHVKPGENITWLHHCTEPGFRNAANLGYSWQSEFRAYHLWKSPVLADYKYMIWMDSDALCTKPWNTDPMKVVVENDLVLLFDNFPQGACTNDKLKDKLLAAYNRTMCKVYLVDGGHLNPHECRENESMRVGNVHGFHHITNLDFYRSPENLRFLEIMVSDYRFSRQWDDQLGVTVPAAMGAPKRAWDYRAHGMNMGIHHNGRLDGKEKNIAFGYNAFWEKAGKKDWQAGREMCDSLVVNKDR